MRSSTTGRGGAARLSPARLGESWAQPGTALAAPIPSAAVSGAGSEAAREKGFYLKMGLEIIGL